MKPKQFEPHPRAFRNFDSQMEEMDQLGVWPMSAQDMYLTRKQELDRLEDLVKDTIE